MSDDAARILAQEGLRHIERATLMLLESHPAGLRNSQIADLLGLALVHPRRAAELSNLFSARRTDGTR